MQQSGGALGAQHDRRVAQPSAVARHKLAAWRGIGEGSCMHNTVQVSKMQLAGSMINSVGSPKNHDNTQAHTSRKDMCRSGQTWAGSLFVTMVIERINETTQQSLSTQQ